MTSEKRVKYVDEFLIFFDNLEEIAKEYGLTLVMKKNIRQYFDDMTNKEAASKAVHTENEYSRPPPPNMIEGNYDRFMR